MGHLQNWLDLFNVFIRESARKKMFGKGRSFIVKKKKPTKNKQKTWLVIGQHDKLQCATVFN